MNTGNPFFTVIIPMYNKAPHVARSVNSALNQTFGDFELIIVDDASTDGSLKEIQKFKDPRIRLLHRDTPGPGGYAARNLGINEAKGKWVAFLDADDEWLPEHLQKMTELSERFPDCDFLSCGWKNVDAGREAYPDRFFERNHTRDSREISLKEYLELCIISMKPTCTDVACLRNNHLAKHLFPEGKVGRGGDQYAWLVYLAQAKKLAWSPHLGAIYYQDSVNMVTNTTLGNPDFIKGINDDLFSLLDKEQSILLLKYINHKIWGAWKLNLFMEPYTTFNLAANLLWKGDVLFCTIHTVISFIPSAILRFARRVKKTFQKLTDNIIIFKPPT